MSGAEHPVEKLFVRAAELLRGEELSAAGDHDAENLLKALEYSPVTPGSQCDPQSANRACLLMAASRFVRIFELAAPDAPGLISFGAQFYPTLADSLHAGSPVVGVSGVGLSLQEAFQGCVGEGIEYLSQLQTGSDVLSSPPSDVALASVDSSSIAALPPVRR